jgi:AraC-like DNA-binding protein
MSAVAALLDSRAELLALRRTIAPGPPSVVACRSSAALGRAYAEHLLDAVVIGVKGLRHPDLPALRAQFPHVPVIVYGPFRPDDGDLLLRLSGSDGVAAIAVEGVDDPVVGDLVRRHSLSWARAEALAEAPRLLRLTEAIQQSAWARLVAVAGQPVTTEQLAERLGLSREHLSRQFGAGGAPNLKRVIDLLRIVCAAQLLANPGYEVKTVTRLLEFAAPSHLNAVSRRITGLPASGLAGLGIAGVVAAFLRRGMRSRR